MRKKKKGSKVTRGEKFLYQGCFLCFLCTILLKVFCGASVGHLNMSVEQLRYNITNQEKKNESLTMKVNELTSFDKVKDIVKDMGLAYNYDNIVVIDEK